MWGAKHCSILFSSVLHQPERFYACTWPTDRPTNRQTDQLNNWPATKWPIWLNDWPSGNIIDRWWIMYFTDP
jgi:hypothetical protein